MNKRVEELLNRQVEAEQASSQVYLSMASWAENQGINGTAEFLYRQADEERQHMLKLVRFINERGGKVIIPGLEAPKSSFESLLEVFRELLEHEIEVTKKINEVVYVCQDEKDYTTHNFMQWYVAEQLEEERMARDILDRLELIGEDKGGLYAFDRDLERENQPNNE